MPSIKLEYSEWCDAIDYHKEEPFFECYFKADKMEVENKEQLEIVLKEHKFLK